MKIVSISQIPDDPVSHNPLIKKRVMIRNGEIPGLTQFATGVFKPDQVAHAHVHDDMWEVFLVVSGSAVITVDGTRHTLSPGTCIVIEPGETHEVTNPGPDDLVINYFGLSPPST